MSTSKRIDWNAVARLAARATDWQLHSALIEINRTLRHADALDRALGTDDGGYYRDEASVLRNEMALRPGFDGKRRRIVDPPQASQAAPGATIDCIRPPCEGRAVCVQLGHYGADSVWDCDTCKTTFQTARKPSTVIVFNTAGRGAAHEIRKSRS